MIVKEKYLENAIEPVRGNEVKNTKQGKRLLRAVIRNEAYKKSYTRLLVDEWFERLELFSKVVLRVRTPKCIFSFCQGIYG